MVQEQGLSKGLKKSLGPFSSKSQGSFVTETTHEGQLANVPFYLHFWFGLYGSFQDAGQPLLAIGVDVVGRKRPRRARRYELSRAAAGFELLDGSGGHADDGQALLVDLVQAGGKREADEFGAAGLRVGEQLTHANLLGTAARRRGDELVVGQDYLTGGLRRQRGTAGLLAIERRRLHGLGRANRRHRHHRHDLQSLYSLVQLLLHHVVRVLDHLQF